MNFRETSIKITVRIFVAAFSIFLPFSVMQPVFARDLSQVQTEISKKNAELEKLKADLKAAEQQLANSKSQENSARSEVDKIEAEIASIDATLQVNQLKLDELAQNKKLKELEKEENEKLQDLQVEKAYIGWKTGGFADTLFGGKDIVKTAVYFDSLTTNSHGGILGIQQELEKINQEFVSFQSSSAQLQKDIEALDQQKQAAQAKLDQAKTATSAQASAVTGLRSQSSSIQSQLGFLSKQEQEIIRQQQAIYNETGNSNIPTTALNNGEFYFEGRGSDFVTGHGVGMSQYGAWGAAKNLGWNAEQILKFYYSGVSIEQGGFSEISVKYCTNNPAEDDPGNGCSDGGSVVVERVSLNTYLAGLSEMPESWPIEARKAQMIAARTYAAKYTNFGDPSRTICLTTVCQVSRFKNGDQGDMDVVNATNGLILKYGGQPISAVYSADNNQGYGTANGATIWGTDTPYLKAANDNSFSGRPYFAACKMWCGQWTWRTYSYSSDEIKVFFNWASTNGANSNDKNKFASLKNLGTIQSIQLGKDPSQRVNMLTFKGSNGQVSVTGKLFREKWNLWNGTKPSGQRDLMYSFSYNSLVAQ